MIDSPQIILGRAPDIARRIADRRHLHLSAQMFQPGQNERINRNRILTHVNRAQRLAEEGIKAGSAGALGDQRIQVKLLKPDMALALTWWSITFPSSKQTVVGNTTMNLQKFDDGWKVIAAHSSTAEM